jgi:hypothetical protein
MISKPKYAIIDYHGLLKKLTLLLPELKSGAINSIIYGSEDRDTLHRRLIIRYMPTAGGIQFSIHKLDAYGIPGSGCYYGQDEALFIQGAQWFLQMIHQRPIHPMLLKIQDEYYASRTLTFYAN